MTTDSDPPESASKAPPNGLGSLDPGELLARGLNTVQPTLGEAPWVPPLPEELARLLPQYHIERLLGHGGMGAVYQGEQPALQRKVAIKLLPADLAMDAMFVARFQREARMLARLQHPGIVAVYDCGQSSAGHLYFVMEYVEGTDLQRVLRDPGLEPEQAMELITQICDALHYAHRQGVIHRDIKPANILLGVDGRVKVADFGLARPNEIEGDELTKTNMVMGTPAYMAPEQRMGHADARADIFALGVMLYEMLTGKRPHGVFDPPSHKVHVDVRIDSVVLKAMQSEPERRYQQVSEMRSDVEDIRTTPLPAEAPPAPPAPPAELALVRSGSKWPLAVVLAAVMLAAGWLMFFPQGQALWRQGTKTVASAISGTPAAAPASTPPVVNEPDRRSLEEALLGSDWLFSNNVGGSFGTHELRFEKGHIVRTNRGIGATWHWWITGERAVHLQRAGEPEQYDPQRGTNLIFYSSLKKFEGLSVNGSQRQTGEPLPKLNTTPTPTPTPRPSAVAAALARIGGSTPRPATPAPTPPWPAPGNAMSDVSAMKQLASLQFARGPEGFPQAEDARWKVGVFNGEYQILCRENGNWWFSNPLQSLRVNDFVCEIRARIFQNADGGWGLGMIGSRRGRPSVDRRSGRWRRHDQYPLLRRWRHLALAVSRRRCGAGRRRIPFGSKRSASGFESLPTACLSCERTHQRLRPASALTVYTFGKKAPVDVRLLSVQVWAPTFTGATTVNPPAPLPSTPAPVTFRATPAPVPALPVDLLSPQNAGFWKTAGGIFRVEGGAWTTSHPLTGAGVAWYTKQTYSDFTLRLEFLTETPTANSGVFVRSPAQLMHPSEGYEIQIVGDLKDPQPTGALLPGGAMYGIRRPTSVPQRAGWNSMEITVVKQDYTITLNGVVTNRFTGNSALAGYIGLQCHHGGPVKFRNLRITDLSGTGR